VTDAAGTHKLSYTDGQLNVEQHSSGPLNGLSVDRDYDSLGRLHVVKLPGNTSITYNYGGNGELASIQTAGGLTGNFSNYQAPSGKPQTFTIGSLLSVSAGYDVLGRPTSRLSTVTGTAAATYGPSSIGYDADGHVSSIGGRTAGYDSHGYLHSLSGIPSYTYVFDEDGNKTGQSLEYPTTRINNSSLTILGTVTPGASVAIVGAGTTVTPSVSGTGFFSQAYDTTLLGNSWQSFTIRGTLLGAGHGGSNAVAQEKRTVFVPSPNESLEYYGSGSRKKDARWTYTWNSLGQMASAVDANPAGVTQLDYTYDLAGRMVQKQVTVAGALARRTITLYDQWKPLLQVDYDGSGVETGRRIYTWGPDVSGTIDGAAGIGGLIEVVSRKGNVTTRNLALNDGLGNVIGLVDGATGAKVATFASGPFGEVENASGERASACPLRWQTKFYDEDLGLYYFGKRWYDPKTLTWLSRDPLRELGGGNLYAYCNDQPVGNYDPIGQSTLIDFNYGLSFDDDPRASRHAAWEQDRALAQTPQSVFDASRRTSDEETAYQNSFEYKIPEMFDAYRVVAVGAALSIPQGVFEATTGADITGSLLGGSWQYGSRAMGLAAVAMDFTPLGELFGAARTPLRTAVRGELGFTFETAAAKGGFQGLGDVTTSSWLGDARIGVTSHLEMFRGGGAFLLPESAYQRFVQGAEFVGRNDGLFITTRGGMDKLLTETGGDLAAINQRLGTFWNEPLWRVDVYNPLLHNARLPSGLEQGANSLFRWGGYTSGGMPEVVLNPVPAGGFSASPIW
jgi:RHS repeat-associated protein